MTKYDGYLLQNDTVIKKKKKSSSASNGVMDIAGFTLSDLEDDDEENFEGFEVFM